MANSGNAGGGIYNDLATLTVSNSTLSGNSAASPAAASTTWRGTLTITNSTFSGNSAAPGGGISTNGTLTDHRQHFERQLGQQRGGGIYNETRR